MDNPLPATPWWAAGTINYLFAGYFGVLLFFLISGFILGVPFASRYLLERRAVPLGPYFLRRLTRLEPPYLIALFGFFFLYMALGHGTRGTFSSSLVWGAPYLANLNGGNHVLTQAWSLEIEVQFYLMVPVITAVFAIRHRIWRRATLVGAILIAATIQSTVLPHALDRTILNYIQYFLTGFLLVDIYLVDWRNRPIRRRSSWDLVWILSWVAVAALAIGRLRPLQPFVLPLVLLLVCVASFRGRVVNRIVTNPWVFTIGGMCYSIYLIHYGVLMLLSRPLQGFAVGGFLTSLAALFLILIPVTLAASAVYFVVVERPCMDRNWPRKLIAWGAHYLDALVARPSDHLSRSIQASADEGDNPAVAVPPPQTELTSALRPLEESDHVPTNRSRP